MILPSACSPRIPGARPALPRARTTSPRTPPPTTPRAMPITRSMARTAIPTTSCTVTGPPRVSRPPCQPSRRLVPTWMWGRCPVTPTRPWKPRGTVTTAWTCTRTALVPPRSAPRRSSRTTAIIRITPFSSWTPLAAPITSRRPSWRPVRPTTLVVLPSPSLRRPRRTITSPLACRVPCPSMSPTSVSTTMTMATKPTRPLSRTRCTCCSVTLPTPKYVSTHTRISMAPRRSSSASRAWPAGRSGSTLPRSGR